MYVLRVTEQTESQKKPVKKFFTDEERKTNKGVRPFATGFLALQNKSTSGVLFYPGDRVLEQNKKNKTKKPFSAGGKCCQKMQQKEETICKIHTTKTFQILDL